MGDISKDFSRQEFACGCKCGFDSIAPALVETVQAIRDAAGAPVIVTSGCRCSKHNADPKVGGVANSSHLEGLAADIYVKDWSNTKLGALIEQLHFEGKLPFLRYCYKIKGSSRAIHVDVDGSKTRSRVFGF